MSAFQPPTNAQWCPDCQRERVSCAHQDGRELATDGGENPPTCDHRDCERPAVALYGGIRPPAGTVRFYSCRRHAPDREPIEEVAD